MKVVVPKNSIRFVKGTAETAFPAYGKPLVENAPNEAKAVPTPAVVVNVVDSLRTESSPV